MPRYDFAGQEQRRIERRRQQRQQTEALDSQVTSEMAARAIQIARSFPNAQPGVVQTAVSQGLNNDATVALASVDDGGGFSPFDVVGGALDLANNAFNQAWQRGIMPTLRGAFVAFDSLYKEAVEAPIAALGTSAAEAIDRSPLSDTLFRGQDLVQGAEGEQASLNPFTNYQQYGRSAGFRFAQGLLDGPGGQSLDLGTGVMVDPESEIGATVRADHRLRVRGEEASIGNFTAAAYLTPVGFDPGDKAYSVISGVQQLAAEIFLDPATLALAGSGVLAKGAARVGASEGVQTAIEGGISGARARARAVDRPEAIELVQRIRALRDEAGNVVDEAAEAQVLDDMMGLVNRNANSRQRTVLTEKAMPWLQNEDIVGRIAEMDAYDLYTTWQKRGVNRVDSDVIRRLGETNDPTEVAEILTGTIARGQVKEKGFYTPTRIAWRSRLNEAKIARFTGMSGVGTAPADDLYAATSKVDTILKAGRVPEEGFARIKRGDNTMLVQADEVLETDEVLKSFGGRRQIANQILALEPGDVPGVRKAIEDGLTSVHLATQGRATGRLSESSLRNARRFVRQFRDEKDRLMSRLQRFNTDKIGQPVAGVFDETFEVGGNEIRLYAPHLVSEGKQLMDVALPAVEDIRRAAVKSETLRKVVDSTGWDMGVRGARWFTSSLFKPLVLLRPAYIARTVGDDQLRLHFSGYDSMFNDPARFASAYLTNPRAATDLMGTSLDRRREAVRLFNQDITGTRNLDRTHQWGDIFKPEQIVDEVVDDAGNLVRNVYSEEFLDAWYVELVQVASDDASRYLVDNPSDFEGLRRWLMSDERIPRITTERTGQEALKGMRNLWGGDVRRIVEEGGDEWTRLARSWQERLNLKAAGDVNTPVPDELRRAIMGESETFNFHADDINGRGRAYTFLQDLADDYAPSGLKREVPRGTGGASDRSGFQALVDGAFEHIVGRPANYFSRNPLWRQAIAENLTDMMPAISREMRQEVIKRAEDLQVSSRWMDDLKAAARRADNSDGFLDDLSEINEIAIGQATNRVEDLLFDVSTRSAAQEQFQAFVPFLDAWREGIEVWSGIVKKHPEVVSRGMSVFRGGESSGFIHTDENGERMFTVPNVTPALRKLVEGAEFASSFGQRPTGRFADRIFGPDTGEDVTARLPARVEGVNLIFSSIGPGFGPVVQWPVAAFAPKGFEDSGLADLVIPYGAELDDPSDFVNPIALAKQLAPAWAKKTFNAATSGGWDEAQYHGMVNEALVAMEATGDYDLSDPLDKIRMTQDAKRSAQWLLMVRGLVHGTFLTGPGAEWRLRVDEDDGFEPEPWDPDEDPEGRWFTLAQMAEEYRNLFDELGDSELAAKQFIQQYGYEPYLLSRPKTRTYGPRPTDTAGAEWMERNEALVRTHPHVAGYFAPEPTDEDFDFGLYRQQIEEGTRELADPEVQIALAQRTKAYQMYNNFKRLLPEGLPQSDERMRLNIIRGYLNEQFPGWQQPVNPVGDTRLDTAGYIDEFRTVSNDPGLSDNPTAQRVRTYIGVRDAALQNLRQRLGDPTATLGRQEAAPIREALLAIGTHLKESDDSQGFVGPWRILARELEVE